MQQLTRSLAAALFPGAHSARRPAIREHKTSEKSAMPLQCPSYIIQTVAGKQHILRCASELDDVCEHIDAGELDNLSVPITQTYLSIGGNEHAEHSMSNALDRDGFYANHERKSIQAIDKMRILGQLPELGAWYKIIFIEQRRRDYETLAKIGKVLNAGGHVLTLSPYRYEGYDEINEAVNGAPIMKGHFASVQYGWGSYDDYIAASPIPENVQLYGYVNALAAATLSIIQLGYGIDPEYCSYAPRAKDNLLINCKSLAQDIYALFSLLSSMSNEMARLCDAARAEGKLQDANAYELPAHDRALLDEWRYKWRPITGRTFFSDDATRLEFIPVLTGWQDEGFYRRDYDFKYSQEHSIAPAAEKLLESTYQIAACIRQLYEHGRKYGMPLTYNAMPILERHVKWDEVAQSFSEFAHATELSSMMDALISGVPLQDILA